MKPVDKLEYEKLNSKLRVQIIRIWDRFFKQFDKEEESEKMWEHINSVICDEHGKYDVYDSEITDYYLSYKCKKYFEYLDNLEECFDVIETVYKTIVKTYEFFSNRNLKFTPSDVFLEINERFKENYFGYECVENKIIRIDNNLLHANIIEKTLDLTINPVFENANEEFLSALEHLKNGKNKEALNDCLKSFESTMKIICAQFKWEYNPDK